MADLVFLGVVAVFFVIAILAVAACDRVVSGSRDIPPETTE